jgi:predicted DNA-binding transcriptional regulator YafY
VASNQLVRQWTVLQELAAARRGRTLGELARLAEASARTIRRDVGDIEAAGFPVERVRDGRQVHFRLPHGKQLPHVPLHFEEALALHQAAVTASLYENPAYHTALESALRKIQRAFPEGVREYLGRVQVAWSHRSPARQNPELPRILRILEEQAAARCRVRFFYGSLQGEQTERTVDPYLLHLHRGELYLLAYCHLRSEIRTFHPERMQHAEPLDEEFHLPPGFDPDALFAQSLGIYLGEPGSAVVRFEEDAARYVLHRPLHPDQHVLERSDGHVVVRVPVRGHDEITHEVLRFGSRAEVLEPPELRAHVRVEVLRLARRYDET